MRAIEKVTAHFQDLETAKIIVPEWDDLEIFVSPITLMQRRKLKQKSDKTDDVGAAIETIILLAMDSNGDPLFTVEDKPDMMRSAAADIVGRVANEILTAHDNADAEKN